ncbi:DUF488 family protein [Delftia sp. K82]|uniref:DUF488 domain-containing protein n=1 Tax=Delftia sp. K82 TaxID=1472718 RepID=UPI000B48D34F|nr:DUF488 domain-containing protein [Delftia sp. K82]
MVDSIEFPYVTVFSIGHGARKIEDFIALLKKYEIEYIIDVRSSPRSRFSPHFNRLKLADALRLDGIGYLFLGESLGGRPKDPNCYDVLGRVDYRLVAERDSYKKGLAGVIKAHEKRVRVACMCSEISACDCHRSKLIGESLRDVGIDMVHITKEGGIESQLDVLRRLADGGVTSDMFGLDVLTKSRKSYR